MQSDFSFHIVGSLDRISIQPGKTLKVVGTVIGPLKKHVGKLVFSAHMPAVLISMVYLGQDVLISQLDEDDQIPLQAQV